MILKVHPSNYRVLGFTDAAPLSDLAALAATAGVTLAHDVGSGLLDRYAGVPRDEPSVAESLRAGAGLVAFSGDKLLGGPQAGLVAGQAALLDRLRRHPIARAVRMVIGKSTLEPRPVSGSDSRSLTARRSVSEGLGNPGGCT